MKTNNNTVHITFALILITVLFSSCFKDRVGDTFYVEGQVLEYGTKTPVANARVVLLESAGEFLGPSYKVLVDSTRTNENGEYSFKYIVKPGAHFISAKADQYFNSEDVYVLDKKKSIQDIIIDPHAWLRVKIVHEGPIGDNDVFAMQYQRCNPDVLEIKEPATYIYCDRAGNRTHNLKYYKTPTSKGTEIIDFSVHLPGHDTTEVVINF